MIHLGSFDANVSPSTRDAYVKQVEDTTRVRMADLVSSSDKITLAPAVTDSQQPMSVADIQQRLKSAGFFPGGVVDGICGYRTLSAMRLFQEYVRSVEGLPSVPDGRFGPGAQQHLQRWTANGLTTHWAPAISAWQAGTPTPLEYGDWLAFLGRVKEHYSTSPTRMVKMTTAFAGVTDTRKVAQWDFSPTNNIHLIGIRRSEMSGKFDDIFVLLLKGLVFKFQGSTEPGASENAAGVPFLVQGQHDYHFGWRKKQYLALRPQHLDHGVLVVRSKGDMRLDDGDLDKGLEPNASINIHWGGKGLTFDVKTWSEGCQVINGSVYINDRNSIVDCSSFAAANNGEIATNAAKTRGAYNMLLDLVTALSGDMPSNAVKYTLLTESDLELGPTLKQRLEEARAKAVAVIH